MCNFLNNDGKLQLSQKQAARCQTAFFQFSHRLSDKARNVDFPIPINSGSAMARL